MTVTICPTCHQSTDYGWTVPKWVTGRYQTNPKRLVEWRRKGWLGQLPKGPGSVYPWDNPAIAAQIRWLKRLVDSGRILDDEDAAAGFRLRANNVTVAWRIGASQWVKADVRHLPAGPYTIAIIEPAS